MVYDMLEGADPRNQRAAPGVEDRDRVRIVDTYMRVPSPPYALG
jgi:hypothetical protein